VPGAVVTTEYEGADIPLPIMRKRILVPAATVVVAAAVVGVIAAQIHGNPAPTKGGHKAATTSIGRHAANITAIEETGHAPILTCEQGETPLGYVGVSHSSESTAARNAPGAGVLTQITDSVTGQTLTLTRSPAAVPAVARSRDSAASTWLPVYPQATDTDLRSCQTTLADRPAARPIIDSAVKALVQAGYFPAATKLEAQLQAALISDDPATSGSVIVTILVEGPVYEPSVPPGAKVGPHPPLHRLVAYTTLEVAKTAKVVGVASGGF
jgi:hypothetical protein